MILPKIINRAVKRLNLNSNHSYEISPEIEQMVEYWRGGGEQNAVVVSRDKIRKDIARLREMLSKEFKEGDLPEHYMEFTKVSDNPSEKDGFLVNYLTKEHDAIQSGEILKKKLLY